MFFEVQVMNMRSKIGRPRDTGPVNWVSDEEVFNELVQLPGFDEGIAQQEKISLLGAMLRDVREKYLKMTQTQAAQLIGIPQSELSRLEAGTGVRGPTFATVTSIVDRYEQYLAPSGIEINLSLEVATPASENFHYALAGRLHHVD
jgi:predicted XRE-type DNA-binding protein